MLCVSSAVPVQRILVVCSLNSSDLGRDIKC